MKLLIVEDDKVYNNLLTAVFEAEGYDVLRAYDGNEAYKLIENSLAVELIISDIQLPKIDGYTFLAMIRNSLKYKAIPFILYSACFTTKTNETMAYELGASIYIRKSGHAKEIIEAAGALTNFNYSNT
jgi:DNA-binding response OmpR family regulator